jgi:hypothetical protein
MLDLSLGEWRIWYEKVWVVVYLVLKETWVLEIYLLKNLKLPHDEFLYNESFNSYHSHIYMLVRLGKLAHTLLALYWVRSTRVRPLSRGWSCSQDQDHLHPHIFCCSYPKEYTKTCLFHPKIYLLHWERIQKRLLGFQINAPRLWFISSPSLLYPKQEAGDPL